FDSYASRLLRRGDDAGRVAVALADDDGAVPQLRLAAEASGQGEERDVEAGEWHGAKRHVIPRSEATRNPFLSHSRTRKGSLGPAALGMTDVPEGRTNLAAMAI